jgi:hypothetical protein
MARRSGQLLDSPLTVVPLGAMQNLKSLVAVNTTVGRGPERLRRRLPIQYSIPQYSILAGFACVHGHVALQTRKNHFCKSQGKVRALIHSVQQCCGGSAQDVIKPSWATECATLAKLQLKHLLIDASLDGQNCGTMKMRSPQVIGSQPRI